MYTSAIYVSYIYDDYVPKNEKEVDHFLRGNTVILNFQPRFQHGVSNIGDLRLKKGIQSGFR